MKNSVICGIYKITSPTNKIYIGQSYDIHLRWKQYKKPEEKIRLNQPKLQSSLKKHGWESHKFEILIECSKDLLDEYEIIFINEFDTYNSSHGMNCTLGGSTNRGRIVSECAKKKISEASKKMWDERKINGTASLSKEHKENIKISITGKKHSEETLNKMRQPRSKEACKNMMVPRSDETKNKLSNIVTDWWVDFKQTPEYKSEEAKKKRSERQKIGWETRRKNKEKQ